MIKIDKFIKVLVKLTKRSDYFKIITKIKFKQSKSIHFFNKLSKKTKDKEKLAEGKYSRNNFAIIYNQKIINQNGKENNVKCKLNTYNRIINKNVIKITAELEKVTYFTHESTD